MQKQSSSSDTETSVIGDNTPHHDDEASSKQENSDQTNATFASPPPPSPEAKSRWKLNPRELLMASMPAHAVSLLQGLSSPASPPTARNENTRRARSSSSKSRSREQLSKSTSSLNKIAQNNSNITKRADNKNQESVSTEVEATETPSDKEEEFKDLESVMDSVLENCTLDLNPDNAMLVIRSPANESLESEKRGSEGGGETKELLSEQERERTFRELEAKAKNEGFQSKGILFNFRDLCSATPGICGGGVFRSACLTRGDVRPEDVHRTLTFLRKGVGIKTIIDLRAKDEKFADKLDWIVEKVFPTVKDLQVTGNDQVKRFNISFINRDLKLKGLFWPCPRATKIKMMKTLFNKDEMTQIFAKDVLNTLGLAGINKLMLTYAGEEIARALRVIGDLRNHPIMIHCASGKDRTGLISALVLSCCGVSEENIVKNYADSEKFLSPVMGRIQEENQSKGLDASFDGTPKEVMIETLEYIKTTWGSMPQYFNQIGFTSEEQQQLASALADTIAVLINQEAASQKTEEDEKQQVEGTAKQNPVEAKKKGETKTLLSEVATNSKEIVRQPPAGISSGALIAILEESCKDIRVSKQNNAERNATGCLARAD